MQLRVLGAYHLESLTPSLVSLLVDSLLALDAGSLTSRLSLAQQAQIRAVLLSHRHYDHVRDLLPLALWRMEQGASLEVYGAPETLEAVAARTGAEIILGCRDLVLTL